MNPEHLLDPASALIVLGGTSLATVLRCGMGDCLAAAQALGGLARRAFDPERARAEMAVQVQEIRQDGVIRSRPAPTGDAEFDEATAMLIGSRCLGALRQAHAAHKRRRVEASQRAVRTLTQAADLSPVFGLAGTLVALNQLPPLDRPEADFSVAISMAVLTTLYGLLLGNLLFTPLARVVARRASDEERDRQAVIDWLEEQVADALPHIERSERRTGRVAEEALS
nr:MotA/TolQ/ExbB proton channel family protein [Novosphingobium panipatense]